MSDFNHRYNQLTETQREIVFLVIHECLSSKEIGKQKGCSWRTVDVHRYKILQQMNCKNFVQLAYEYGKNTN